MIVSQFVIGNNPHHGFATHHRVLLTNLATKAYFFRLTLHSRTWQFDQKVAYSVERPNWFMLDLVQPAGAHKYRGRYTFVARPRETVIIQLRPFDVPAFQAAQESMQAPGHVELTIPETWAGVGESTAPQGDEPVKVLLHAFQLDWALTSGYRDAAPVTLSTGKAENEIMPDQPKPLVVPVSLAAVQAELTPTIAAAGDESPEMQRREDIAAFVEDPRSVVAILAFLGRVGEDRQSVEALNALLREAGHAVRLRARRERRS
jgi:hypothetical protein